MREIHLDIIDSTNAYAKKHCDLFPKDQITCIIAEEQTAGKGRYQRNWTSPKGGLYVTFYFTLPLNTLHLVSLSQVMAVSFSKVLTKEGFFPKVKWPNDIQLSGKKVCGILCETKFQHDSVDLFLGIGINVNLDQKSASQIDQPATSLAIETGKQWDKEALLQKLQVQFEKDLARFKKEGFSPFHKEFENLMLFKGEKVRCFDGKKTWEGVCHSLSDDGGLNLLLEKGDIHKVLAGDIKGS